MRNLKFVTFISVLLLFFVVCSQSAWSEIVFEDNFDNDPDWYPQYKFDTCKDASCKEKVPGAWNYYYNQELWHPNYLPGSHPTIQISGENHYGTYGKAFTRWNEANFGDGDGWGPVAHLVKDLGRDYNEIFFRIKIKFQPGFKWELYGSSLPGSALKILRLSHWDRIGSPLSAFENGYQSPMYLLDLANSNDSGFRHLHAIRCDPQETNYYCGGKYNEKFNFNGKPTFEESLGDGNWHALEWRIKMNSTPGVADGIIEFRSDDNLQYIRNDIEWMGKDSPGNLGWNIFGLGHNAYNSYIDTWSYKQTYSVGDTIVYNAQTWKAIQQNTNSKPNLYPSDWTKIADYSGGGEEWYAIDDVVISTSPIGPDYVIGSSTPSPSPLPAPAPVPQVNNKPVANNKNISTIENIAVSVTLTGTDQDSDILTYTVLTNPSHGALSGMAPNLTFTPTSGYIGADAFTFSVNDGKDDSNIASVNLTVASAPVPIGGGLVGYYDFEGNTIDRSGNNNNGTAIGAILTSGKFGQAYQFDGSNQSISIDEAANLDGFNQLTVSLWFNTSSYGINTSYPLLVSKSNTSSYAIGITPDSSGRIFSYVNGSALTSTNGFMSNKLGGWHHVVLTYNGSEQALYFDGVKIANKSQTGMISDYLSPVIIGNRDNMGAQFSGLIDDVAIYSKAMTIQEIQNIYNSGVPLIIDTTAPAPPTNLRKIS